MITRARYSQTTAKITREIVRGCQLLGKKGGSHSLSNFRIITLSSPFSLFSPLLPQTPAIRFVFSTPISLTHDPLPPLFFPCTLLSPYPGFLSLSSFPSCSPPPLLLPPPPPPHFTSRKIASSLIEEFLSLCLSTNC